MVAYLLLWDRVNVLMFSKIYIFQMDIVSMSPPKYLHVYCFNFHLISSIFVHLVSLVSFVHQKQKYSHKFVGSLCLWMTKIKEQQQQRRNEGKKMKTPQNRKGSNSKAAQKVSPRFTYNSIKQFTTIAHDTEP